jgi:P-type Cu2+ transporter
MRSSKDHFEKSSKSIKNKKNDRKVNDLNNRKPNENKGSESEKINKTHIKHGHMNNENHDMEMGSKNHSSHMHIEGKSNEENSGKMNHANMMDMENLKRRLWISLILTIPIIILSPMMGINIPFQIHFTGSDWIVLILGTILYFYCGQPFFDGAKTELKHKRPAMMTLITMGITVAYFYSLYSVIVNNLFTGIPMVSGFFWELATLIDIMLIGHILEMNSIMNAGSALSKLAKLLPNKAHKIEKNEIKDISTNKLVKEDKVQVRSGEKIPADGTLLKGQTTVNESMITGESKQIMKQSGDKVIGGSINGEGTFEMIITGTGESSYLAQVQKLVSDAQKEQSKREDMADRIARLLFYVALLLGIGSFLVWFRIESIAIAFSVAVTILVIACPHALGLAIPLVVSRSTSIGASNGLLFRNRISIEQTKSLDYALMDKTGTLTEGDFKVTSYKSLINNSSDPKYKSDEEILKISASLEKGSSHPLAVGILKKAEELNLSYPKATDIFQETGVGIRGKIKNIDYKIVSSTYLDKKDIKYPIGYENKEKEGEKEKEKEKEKNNRTSYNLIEENRNKNNNNKTSYNLIEENRNEKNNNRTKNMNKNINKNYNNYNNYNENDDEDVASKKIEFLGNTISYLMEGDDIIGVITQGDKIKEDANYMVDSLKKQKIIPVMLTGDNEETANIVGEKLGIEEIYSKLLPQDKEKIVKEYQNDGFKVMMIGDGVNDAPSIARADVGVAIGSGTDIAIDSADIILVKSNPRDVIKLLELAKTTTRKMSENLIWGAGYNIIALPLAAGIFAPFGFILNPMIGAIFMSASTLIVAVNAMLLRIK